MLNLNRSILSSSQQKTVQIILLSLIVVGVGLLITQKLWVPQLVTFILADELAALTSDVTASSTSTSTPNQASSTPSEPVLEDTDEPSDVPVIVPPVGEGDAALALGESGQFGTLMIKPLLVEEDSRCPIDVTCIQAGTVRLSLQIGSAQSTSTTSVKLEEELVIDGAGITLVEVSPQKSAEKPIRNEDYRFSFTVEPQIDPVTSDVQNTCYVGGCSSQLCTDRPDMVSTCEYREEFMCYQTAECKRQTTGQCGWTETAELRSCLSTNRNDVR